MTNEGARAGRAKCQLTARDASDLVLRIRPTVSPPVQGGGTVTFSERIPGLRGGAGQRRGELRLALGCAVAPVYPAAVGVVRFFRVASTSSSAVFWAIIIAAARLRLPRPLPPTSTDSRTRSTGRRSTTRPARSTRRSSEALESQIDAIEARSGAEIAIYVQVDASATAGFEPGAPPRR